MRLFYNRLLFFVLLLVCCNCFPVQKLMAQAKKRVSGYVFDKDKKDREKKDVPFSLDNEMYIIPFNTVAEAEDFIKNLENNPETMFQLNYVAPDVRGFYEVIVPETGALVFKIGIAEPILERVNFRMEINVYVNMGRLLDNVTINGDIRVVTALEPEGERYGNFLAYRGGFNLPARDGRTNARMTIKPYVVNHNRKDTFCYRIPRVYQGEEYSKTQARWVGYDLSRDSLTQFIRTDIPFNDQQNSYAWADTVILPNPNESFQVFADVTIEDYNGVYFNNVLTLSPKNPRRPLSFLEFSFGEAPMDPQKYKEYPNRQYRSGVEDLSLNFLIGKAELDPADSSNFVKLGSLKDKLMEIVNNPDSKLQEIHVRSVSSPDGSYASNLALSKRRLAFAEKTIQNMLPAQTRERLYMYTEDAARVAGWDEVAELMRKDSLNAEADMIMEIVNDNLKNRDLQSIKMRKLPFYETLVTKYLPKLRSMTCEYTAQVYRALTPEEIYDKYQNDPDYRNGKKTFESLYEYWNLFNMIKDEKELEFMYKQAYDFSKSISPDTLPWAYAANCLAVSYLKRDTIDISILEPLIDRKVAYCNVERKFNGRVIKVVNIEEIVANQLLMYLRAQDYDNASVLAQILGQNPKYESLWAFAYCLKGYYKFSLADGLSEEEMQKRKKVFQIVKDSSPLNEVVMCLAMKNATYDRMAERALAKLPQNDAKTFYLKTIVALRKGDIGLLDAQQSLMACFYLDRSYIEYAKTDGDMSEDLLELVLESMGE